MFKSLLITCLALFCVVGVFAQPITTNSFAQKLKAAEEAEAMQNYAGALDWYTEAYDELRAKQKSQKSKKRNKDPRIDQFALKIASLNYELRDYKRAAKGFERVLRKDDENQYIDYRFIYAKTLKASAQFTQALEEFNKVISLSEDEKMQNAADFEIRGIELIPTLEKNVETDIGVLDKKINSPSAEHSPRESGDGSFYYGSFDRKTPVEPESEDKEDYHAKIFVSTRDKEGKFVKGEALDQNINRKNFNNTHLALSRDGRTMFFTRIQMVGTEITSSKLMVSYKKDSGWSAANEVPGLNGEWSVKHPAVGQLFGNDVLFFVSDMEGGEGNFDIFYADIKNDGTFSSPVNLGKTINTSGDELSPYYYEGTLYFSTNGHPTIGGFDVYYTLWDGENWSEPENMGLGYNSSYDDIFFTMATEGGRGYFVSNRPVEGKKKLISETCCDDIFEFNIREVVVDLLAIVVDQEDAPLNEATIKLENLSDPVNYPTDIKYNSLGNEFNFLLDSDFKYRATITKQGYYPDTIEFNTAGILDNYTVKKKITLEAQPTEPEIEIVTINQPIRLNNIYYDFDDDEILPDAEKDLTFLEGLMIEYPDMVIELSSHTDSQGPARYNQELSQRRADSAKKWLEKRGIKKNRINAVGYGEKVILNKCKNRVPCSDEEHRVNRRTEFKIIAGPQTIEIKREQEKQ